MLQNTSDKLRLSDYHSCLLNHAINVACNEKLLLPIVNIIIDYIMENLQPMSLERISYYVFDQIASFDSIDMFCHFRHFLKTSILSSDCKCYNQESANHLLLHKLMMELIVPIDNIEVFCDDDNQRHPFVAFTICFDLFPDWYEFGRPGQPFVRFGIINEHGLNQLCFTRQTNEAEILHFLNGGGVQTWEEYIFFICNHYFHFTANDFFSIFRRLAIAKFHEFLLTQLASDFAKAS